MEAAEIKNVVMSVLDANDASSIAQFRNKLVITTNELNHRNVAQILASLLVPNADRQFVGVYGVAVPKEMAAEIQQLWKSQYQPKLITANGRVTNFQEVLGEFKKDAQERIKEREKSTGAATPP